MTVPANYGTEYRLCHGGFYSNSINDNVNYAENIIYCSYTTVSTNT